MRRPSRRGTFTATSVASLTSASRRGTATSREVRCFFNWLVDGRYLRDNPFRGIKNVRLPQRIVEPFSPADIAQLMAACDSATALGLRDRAMVLCLLDTGLRCSELVQLTLDDLDLETRRAARTPRQGQQAARGAVRGALSRRA